ncbi:MAG: hypothetical protein AAGI44_02350 [Pseudomonadota bacterium]
MQLSLHGDRNEQMQLLLAITQIRAHQRHHFDRLLDALRHELAQVDQQLRHSDAEQFQRAQGNAQRLESLIEFLEEAPSKFKEMKDTPSQASNTLA